MRTGFAAAAAAVVTEVAVAKDQKATKMRTEFAVAAVIGVAAAKAQKAMRRMGFAVAVEIAEAVTAVAMGRKATKMQMAVPHQGTEADWFAVEAGKGRIPEKVGHSTGQKQKYAGAVVDRKRDCFEARSVLGWHTGLTYCPAAAAAAAAEEPVGRKGYNCHSKTGLKLQIVAETMA